LDEQGGFVHLADGHDHGKKSNASGLCDVLAALSACASNAANVFAAISSVQEFPHHFHSAPRAAEAPPFLSQGPPALL
jgi:hypothetical protein